MAGQRPSVEKRFGKSCATRARAGFKKSKNKKSKKAG